MSVREKIRPYLGDRQFYKQLLFIALPISMQSLITIGVNLMDTIMLGTMGEIAISGSSLANQFINLFQIFCMGMGMGASVLTSRYWGMQNLDFLRKSVTIMYRLCFFIGLVFTAATMFFPAGIMRIFTAEEAVIEAGVRYFKWSIPTYWLMGFSLTTTIVLRSIKQVWLPLITSIMAFFINVFFNWLFIFGNLGAPRMEVEGAALGTLIARIFEFVIICGYFLFVEKKVAYRLKNIFMKCGDLVKDYLRISIPVLISDGLLGLGNSVVAIVMGHIGAAFVSANAITTVTQQLSTVIIQGMSNASAIITGHTLGKGEKEKSQRQGVTFLGLGAIFGILAGGIIMVLSWPIINCYNITAETKSIAEELMLAVGFIVIFQSMNSILTKGVLRGGGDTKFLMVADVLFLWVAAIPLGWLAGLYWCLPAFWIYFFLRIDQIIKAVWCIFRLGSKKWIRTI